jgi:hypothetical protein
MLVRDDDWHAGHAAEYRSPQVGPEQMGVEHVNPLFPEDPHKASERGHMEPMPPIECHVGDPGGSHVVDPWPDGRARRGHHDVEAVAGEIRRKRNHRTLGAAALEHLVDQHQDAEARLRGGSAPSFQ